MAQRKATRNKPLTAAQINRQYSRQFEREKVVRSKPPPPSKPAPVRRTRDKRGLPVFDERGRQTTAAEARRLGYAWLINTGDKGDTLRDRKIKLARQSGLTVGAIDKVLRGETDPKTAAKFWDGFHGGDYNSERAATLNYLSDHQRSAWTTYQRDLKASYTKGRNPFDERNKRLRAYNDKLRSRGQATSKMFPGANEEWFDDLLDAYDSDLTYMSG